MKVLAIIPCFNEGENIKNVIEDLKIKTPDIDFIIINDGSFDNTNIVCIENNYPFIDIPFNLGLSNAIQTGMCYALKNNYDMALQFDGDGQHKPEYISRMILLMTETQADIVIGVRKKKNGVRNIGSNLLKIAIKLTTSKYLTDPTSGMRLYNRKMIEEFAKNINYGPEPDTLAYLLNRGILINEIPVEMNNRTAGTSYLNTLNAIIYMLRMFVSILIIQWFRYRRK
ncbi:MAG: glycosyltransferase family 2 protein [Treponema sp.]|nr:glycosyltransferase family 2 protein [Treponema sp.]